MRSSIVIALLSLLTSNASGQTVRFFHHDAQGNLIAKTDDTGQVVWRAEPDPFGAYTTHPSDSPQRFLDQPQEDSGLFEIGARFYHPVWGRFITSDPLPVTASDLANPDAQNRYAYALNNPYRFHDASGQIPVETLLDIADIGLSAYDLWNEPSWANAGFLAWSTAAAFIPYVPGAWAAKAVKHGGRAADAIATAKKVENATDVVPSAIRCPCFAGGTLVKTEEGPRPIDTIRSGDLVLARDETTGAHAFRPVTRVFITPEKPLVRLELIAFEDGEPLASEVIETTPDHPFWVVGQGWTVASELEADAVLETANGVRARVGAATLLGSRATVYNLEVDGLHNYFVGEVGAWVHNTCICDELGTGNTGPKLLKANDLDHLSTQAQRSVRSLEKRMFEHREKLEAFKRNPDAFDNKGFLRNAPSPEVRQRIIDGRIRHLEREIRSFEQQIQTLIRGGG